jgi:protein-S-isoprenylcysteine O-methyltransferase Ste14
MIRQHIVLGLLWVIYCVLHSLLASSILKVELKKWMGTHYYMYRIAYTLFAFLTLVLIIFYGVSIRTEQIFDPGFIIKITGVIIGSAGLILMLVCIKKYFVSLSGLRSLIKEEYSNQLLITGVHKYVRHPLYTGTFAFLWGLFLVYPYLNLFVSNVVITIYTLIGIRLEEEKLIKEFGEQYRVYRQKVPRLFPLIRLKKTL